MRRRLIAVLCALTYTSVYAWGPRGHAYSGAIADELLTARARARVEQILGMPLRTAATWADCVKDVRNSGGQFEYLPDPKYHAACAAFETAEGKAEMVDYVRRNWNNCSAAAETKDCHKRYHYADVAVQHDRYDRQYVGTSNHDIVSAVNAAIAVLQGNPPPAPFDIKNQKEALFLLAHLIGDLHQPLHVGAIYLDEHDQPVDPDQPPRAHDPAIDTRGGNAIEVGSSNLHADWDNVPASLRPDTVGSAVIERARSLAKPRGPMDGWAQAWASQTVQQARQAYSGMSYAHTGTAGKWVAHFDDRRTYGRMKRDMQMAQLEKAGARLANVLNEVFQ